ncbi:MAG: PepSY domain-containing protein, partial [Gammaproteobacteria bacterium]|nr:PepSY domain-containing protein [Gammaproteobacteria bacterium]
MNTPFRKQLVSLHTWSGLVIGLVLAFLALTAAAFVLRPALQRTVYSHLLTVPACHHRLPLDRLAAEAQAIHQLSSLQAIRVASAETSSVAVQF